MCLTYSGNLNSELIWYSNHGYLFTHQMVHYSDARDHGTGSIGHLNSKVSEHKVILFDADLYIKCVNFVNQVFFILTSREPISE